MNKSLKLAPPSNLPIGGIRISLTTDVTIFPNAPPIMTPTARSITLPFTANSLNSLIKPIIELLPSDVDIYTIPS
ncbi:hypothetical protein D3C75_869390 [compost metagenome]